MTVCPKSSPPSAPHPMHCPKQIAPGAVPQHTWAVWRHLSLLPDCCSSSAPCTYPCHLPSPRCRAPTVPPPDCIQIGRCPALSPPAAGGWQGLSRTPGTPLPIGHCLPLHCSRHQRRANSPKISQEGGGGGLTEPPSRRTYGREGSPWQELVTSGGGWLGPVPVPSTQRPEWAQPMPWPKP